MVRQVSPVYGTAAPVMAQRVPAALRSMAAAAGAAEVAPPPIPPVHLSTAGRAAQAAPAVESRLRQERNPAVAAVEATMLTAAMVARAGAKRRCSKSAVVSSPKPRFDPQLDCSSIAISAPCSARLPSSGGSAPALAARRSASSFEHGGPGCSSRRLGKRPDELPQHRSKRSVFQC